LPTVYDTPPDRLIKKLALYLKENFEEVVPPQWAYYAKTGAYKERPPQDRDWWYLRCASLLRKLYISSPIGVSRLRKEYGGRKRKGRLSERTWKGSGSAVRDPLHQLEKIGLVEIGEKEGRKLTREGRSTLDKIATEIVKELKTPKVNK